MLVPTLLMLVPILLMLVPTLLMLVPTLRFTPEHELLQAFLEFFFFYVRLYVQAFSGLK